MLAQSGICRRIVGRVDPGEDACAALAAICEANAVTAGEVRATGVLAHLELSELDPAGGPYRPAGRIEGPLTLIQAYGNVSKLGDQTLVIMRGLVSWDDRGQHRVAGGHMLSAESVTVEFVIDAFDDISIERALDPASGMPVFSKVSSSGSAGAPAASAPAAPAPSRAATPSPAPTPVKRDPPPAKPDAIASAAPPASAPAVEEEAPAPIASRRPSGWDMVAAASEALDHEEPEDDWVEGLDADFKRADVLLHPRFGRCKVLRIEAEERVVLMDGNGKPRTVSLEYLRVQRDPDVPDARVFHVRIGRG